MYAESTAVSSMLSDDFYLARQPILGRDRQPVAFELLFRAAPSHHYMGSVTDVAATAAVIAYASQLGLKQVVGEQVAFVNVDDAVLMSDFVQFLPHDKVVLEILETVRPTTQIIKRIIELKELGFRFALDDVINYSDLVNECLDLVDVVKIDLRGTSREQLCQLVHTLRDSHRHLLAEKVETAEEFKLCLDLGFEYFQGYYFAPPAILSGKRINPSGPIMLRLLNLIRADASEQSIEQTVERDSSLKRNLLRLVNSDPTDITKVNIDTISQALHFLGRNQLQRWLEILLTSLPATFHDAGLTRFGMT